MTTFKDSITARATVEDAYAALSTQAGYTGWWSKDCEIATEVGKQCRLRFDKQGTLVNMTFRIDALAPNESVRWTCVAHDMPPWVDTTLAWDIARTDDDNVEITLVHGGWNDPVPPPVAQGWQHFLSSLKSYLETGTGQPW